MTEDDEDSEVDKIVADLQAGLVQHDPVEYARTVLAAHETIGKTSLELVRERERESDDSDIRKILAEANVGTKMKYAMLGNATCRQLLIADRNAMVAKAVLKNPRLTLPEVEAVCGDRQASESILRAISDDIAWNKNYSVRHALVTNPKTPPDAALKWLRYLQKPHIKEISRSKNVSHVVATAAKRLAQ